MHAGLLQYLSTRCGCCSRLKRKSALRDQTEQEEQLTRVLVADMT
jgi:hypothetical protein